MHHLDFFDIPVYRLPLAEYEAQKAAYIDKEMYQFEHPAMMGNRKKPFVPNQDFIQAHRAHLDKVYGGTWLYNEIIGYIGLHFLGSQIRGEYFKVDAKKIVRTRKKTFTFQTWKIVGEEDLPYPWKNESIYMATVAYLERVKEKLKGRYVDTKLFETIGPHVDWVGLIRTQEKPSKSKEKP